MQQDKCKKDKHVAQMLDPRVFPDVALFAVLDGHGGDSNDDDDDDDDNDNNDNTIIGMIIQHNKHIKSKLYHGVCDTALPAPRQGLLLLLLLLLLLVVLLSLSLSP